MKKAILSLTAALALISMSNAQVDLQSFGSGSFTIDAGSTAAYTQDLTGITMNVTPAAGDTWYNSAMTKLVADWSSFPQFGIRMSLTGANPSFSFSVDFFDSGFNLINSYVGSTAAANSTPSVINLTLNTPGTGNLSGVEFVQFTWGGGGSAINTTMTEVVGVPEPSTYALLAISAAAFGGYVIRRRKRA